MVHYSTIIKKLGPIKRLWCFRFEAFHKIHKTYARNITSRTNIPLTLCIKSSLRFSYLLSTNNFFQKETEIVFDDNQFDLEKEPYFVNLDLSCLEQNTVVYKMNHVIFKGTKFKKGFFLTVSKVNCELPYLYEIIEIVSSNLKTNKFFAVCKQWDVVEYFTHLLAYICEDNNNRYFTISLNEIDGPPIHVYKLPNGKNVIRLKKYF